MRNSDSSTIPGRRGPGPVALAAMVLWLGNAAPVARAETASASAPASTSAFQADLRLAGVASLDSLRAAGRGRWLLVNVWATWCRPCVAETPDLVRLAAELQGEPFALVGVSTDDMLEPTTGAALRKVDGFATKYRVGYPQLVYTGHADSLAARFALSGVLPTTVLYDSEGREVERWEGKLSTSHLRSIRARIK